MASHIIYWLSSASHVLVNISGKFGLMGRVYPKAIAVVILSLLIGFLDDQE